MRWKIPPQVKIVGILALTYLFLISVGLMIGVLTTSIVQSWSLTTSLVVGMAELVIAVVFLFVALRCLVAILRSPVIARLDELFGRYVFSSPMRGPLLGVFLTALVQSSSIALSVIAPLAGAGISTLAPAVVVPVL